MRKYVSVSEGELTGSEKARWSGNERKKLWWESREVREGQGRSKTKPFRRAAKLYLRR
jgi:hypothetical protein